MQNIVQKNNVHLHGQIAEPFIHSHTSHGMKIFSTKIKVNRLSGFLDMIPLMVPEELLYGNWKEHSQVGMFVSVFGSIRSFSAEVDGRTRLHVFVYADVIGLDTRQKWANNVSLDGYICKAPIYRRTPRDMEICDTMLAVNRKHGKRSYIPVIYWDELARSASHCSVGDMIRLDGRIQSREYTKILSDGTTEHRTCYEISAQSLQVLKEAETKSVRI